MDENFSIASNNIDKIAFGGVSKKVFIQDIAIKNDELQFEGESKLAMQFDSSVTKVEFVGAKHLLGLSEDSSV